MSDLRTRIFDGLSDPEGTIAWLIAECGVNRAGAEQMIAYVRETVAVLGCVPTQDRIVAERFFDESGGMQLVLHTPFGGRINRAWGLAMRKRFCVNFDFELQAAATDDGIVLSLGEQHSFPLESAWAFVRPHTAEPDLVQALLASPMFTNRWRWNANRSLAVLRFSGGRRVPMPIQRMRAEDLLGSVFPEQVQCQDNRSGPITPPDHPLVNETMNNCLTEAMDITGLKEIVGRIERGELRTVAVETPVPSAMSHEILNANPYAFLDDAPLEERRARAVSLRRTDPDLARGVGALDASAIDEVRSQAWPDVRDADELHDALLTVGVLPTGDVPDAWQSHLKDLLDNGRTTVATWKRDDGWDHQAYVAAERMELVRSIFPEVRFSPELTMPLLTSGNTVLLGEDEAIRSIVHGWIQVSGPVSVPALASRIGIRVSAIEIALAALEGSGIVLRGRFTPGAEAEEWCERGLLARIHRLTVGRLRKEIEAVTPADFMRYLLRWQHVQRGSQLHGRDGLTQIIGQLQGLELPAPAWEEHVLPSRIRLYDPADLEYLSLSGMVTWGRLTANGAENGEGAKGKRKRRQAPGRNSPIAFVMREDLPYFLVRDQDPDSAARSLSSAARDVLRYLEQRGASFMADIIKNVRRMPVEVEEALWELVSHGFVSGDGVAGLRQLMHGSARDRSRRRLRMMALRSGAGLSAARPHTRSLPVGRWALWQPPAELDGEERGAAIARQLLRRYGVVFRDVLVRERIAPAWRVLLDIYRKWEAQGEIRGGRFVSGFVGEQFALPEAVDALRAVRRSAEDSEPVVISAADPLNLVGIILPGVKVSPFSGMGIAYKNGAAEDVAPMGVLLSRLRRPPASVS